MRHLSRGLPAYPARAGGGNTLRRSPWISPRPHYRLTAAAVEAMDDDAFARRAYAWRGRQTILRNLRLLEGDKP